MNRPARQCTSDAPQVRLLLVEDEPVQRRILERRLCRAGYAVDTARNGEEALDKLQKEHYQVLVTDWEMPGMDGTTLCRRVRGMNLPSYLYILLLTGHDSSADMVAGLEAGADDYVRKPAHEPELLARLKAGCRIVDLTRDLQATNDQLTVTNRQYRMLIENTSAVPWELDRETWRTIYIAPQISTIFGIPSDTGTTTFLDFLHPQDREAFKRFATDAARGLIAEAHIDSRLSTTDDDLKYVRSFVSSQSTANEGATICGISLDVTQQKKLELELSQAQKLESIGQLAAGIAHEINTPTQFIGDNVRFLRDAFQDVVGLADGLAALVADPPGAGILAASIRTALAKSDVTFLRDEIPNAIAQSLEGVERIAKIVGAMKEFSHPGMDRTPVDLNRAIENTLIVASSEWKHVADVTTDFDPALPLVLIVPGTFNQVILNIIVNAAHAVEAVAPRTPASKGLISVSTRRVDDWAEIRIQDSGCGIPEKIIGRIFDPFFTTKPVGKGTGQGLCIAHDVVVKKHGGTITAHSEPGVGTTFTVRLPLESPSPLRAIAI